MTTGTVDERILHTGTGIILAVSITIDILGDLASINIYVVTNDGRFSTLRLTSRNYGFVGRSQPTA
jgi:hypothetical protein